jgi:hypothetical protein
MNEPQRRRLSPLEVVGLVACCLVALFGVWMFLENVRPPYPELHYLLLPIAAAFCAFGIWQRRFKRGLIVGAVVTIVVVIAFTLFCLVMYLLIGSPN